MNELRKVLKECSTVLHPFHNEYRTAVENRISILHYLNAGSTARLSASILSSAKWKWDRGWRLKWRLDDFWHWTLSSSSSSSWLSDDVMMFTVQYSSFQFLIPVRTFTSLCTLVRICMYNVHSTKLAFCTHWFVVDHTAWEITAVESRKQKKL